MNSKKNTAFLTHMQSTLKPSVLILIVFGVVFAVRLAFIIETRELPLFRTLGPGFDNDLHWQAAGLLLEGVTTDEPCFELMICSTPLHQYWVAFSRWVLGDSLLVHRVFTALIASLSALLMFRLIFLLTRRYYIACLCSLMWAMLPSLLYFDTTIHKSVVEILLLSFLLNLAVFSSEKTLSRIWGWVRGAGIGLLLSGLLLIQGNTFLYLIVISIFVLLRKETAGMDKLRLLLPAVAIFSAFFIYMHGEEAREKEKYPWYQPVKGAHFFIGNNKTATGFYKSIPGVPASPSGHAFYGRMYAEIAENRKMTPAEADRYFIDSGLDFIFHSPGAAAALAIKKAGYFFSNFEPRGTDNCYYLQTVSMIMKSTPMGLGILVILAPLGIIRLVQRKEYALLFLFTGLLGAMLIGNLLGFVTWRYRLHNVVPLILLASLGLLQLEKNINALVTGNNSLLRRVVFFILKIGIPVGIAGLVAYRPVSMDLRESYLKDAKNKEQLVLATEKIVVRLQEITKTCKGESDCLKRKALLLAGLHRYSESYRLLQKIPLKDHDRSSIHRCLRYFFWLGEYDRAGEFLDSVRAFNPLEVEAAVMRLCKLERDVYHAFVIKGRDVSD